MQQEQKINSTVRDTDFDKAVDATLFKSILMLVPRLGVCKPCFKNTISLNNDICMDCLSKYIKHFEEKGISIKNTNCTFTSVINNLNDRIVTRDVFYIDNKPAIKVKDDGFYKLGKPPKVPDKIMDLKKNYVKEENKMKNIEDCLYFVLDLFFTHSKTKN